MKINSNYIVYGLLDTNNKPFYIGMGVPNRPFQHFTESERRFNKHSNKNKLYKIRKIFKNTGKYPKVKIYKKGLTQDQAYKEEIELIFKIGLNNLTNLKLGGQGGFFNNWSEEIVTKSILKMIKTKKRLYKEGKLIAWNRGLTKEKDIRVKEYGQKGGKTRKELGSNKGKKHGLYGKLNNKHPAFGYKHTKEAKDKITLARMGLKNHNSKKCKITTPNNKTYVTCVNEFIRNYGKVYNIKPHFLRNLGNKKVNGWKIKYI